MSGQVKNIRANVYLNQKGAGKSLRELSGEAKKLKNQLNLMNRESKEFGQKKKEFQKINRQIKKQRDSLGGVGTAWRNAADKFNRYSVMVTAGVAAITGVVLALQSQIENLADLSDLRADIQRTTELSNTEINKLTKNFKKFNTRTPRKELMMLATQAGKMGVRGVPALTAFVEQANELNVALGDELGDNATLTIGKMASIFDTSIKKIGSGINAVSDSTKAQAGFLTEFLSRLAGISKATDIAAGDVLGYGATLDELGLKVEMTGTALNTFFADFSKDTEKFGRAAGFANGELTKLLAEKGTNEAFLAFLEQLNSGTSSTKEFLNVLEKVGIDGSRKSQTFLALAQNVDQLRDRQNLANKEIEKGTSLTKEYDRRNTNFAATLAKIRRKIYSAFINQDILKAFETLANKVAIFIGAVADPTGRITAFKNKLIAIGKILLIAASATLSYKAALKLSAMWANRAAQAEVLRNIATKASAVATNLAIGAQALYIIGTNALTGKIKLATAAQRAFNVVTRLHPIGLLTAAITGITVAYLAFKKETVQLTAKQKLFQSINTKVEKSIASERAQIQKLLFLAKAEGLAKEKRIKAVKKLRELAPKYLGHLELETIHTEKATKAIDNYIESLKHRAKIKASQEKLVELNKKLIDAETSSINDQVKWYDVLTQTILMGTNAGKGANFAIDKAINRRNEETGAIKSQIEALLDYRVSLEKTDSQILDQLAWNAAKALRTGTQTLKDQFAATPYKKSAANFRNFLALRLKDAGKNQKQIAAILNPEDKEDKPKPDISYDPSDDQINARKNAKAEILSMLDNQNQTEVEKTKEKWAKILAQAEKYKIKEKEVRLAMEKAIRTATLKENEKARIEEQKRIESLLNQAFEAELQSQKENLTNQKEFEALTKRERDQALLDLEIAHLEKMRDARIEAGLSVDEVLEELHQKNLNRTEKEIKMKLESMDKVMNQSRLATDFVNALKNQELSQIQAITRRQGESEEDFTARKEKQASKRKEIQKKYAVAEALSSVFQIGATTAEAVMKAIAASPLTLGMPWSGIIAATGVLQSATALAQVGKVKSLESGGFTGNKGIADVNVPGRKITGVVHDDEYVVPTEELLNPNTKWMVQEIEKARLARRGGFVSGGPTNPTAREVVQNTTNTQNINLASLENVVGKLTNTLKNLERNGIPAIADDRFERDMKEKRERDTRITDNSRI